jgi:hypothetical protein
MKVCEHLERVAQRMMREYQKREVEKPTRGGAI